MPAPILILGGERYGRLTIIAEADRIEHGGQPRRAMRCRCACGRECVVTLKDIRNGNTASCGCLVDEFVPPNKTHGLSKHPVYFLWKHMVARCNDPDDPDFDLYGGRGICVCEEWAEPDGFPAFYGWSIANDWTKGMQIDRRDNDGNYCPSNCRFVTSRENTNNRRNTTWVDVDGDRIPFGEFRERYKDHGVHRATAWIRFTRMGWSAIDAVTIPAGGRRHAA